MTYLDAQTVALRLGLKTSTLARWRRDGKGPTGWFRISENKVVYPAHEVDRFFEERRRASEAPTRSFPQRAS